MLDRLLNLLDDLFFFTSLATSGSWFQREVRRETKVGRGLTQRRVTCEGEKKYENIRDHRSFIKRPSGMKRYDFCQKREVS